MSTRYVQLLVHTQVQVQVRISYSRLYSGAVELTRHLAPEMVNQGGGTVVNVSSLQVYKIKIIYSLWVAAML